MDGNLLAFDRKSGTLIWQQTLAQNGRLLRASPMVANGVVYVATLWYSSNDPGMLYALDAAPGTIIMQNGTAYGLNIGYGIYSSPARYNNYLYLVECDSYWHTTNDVHFYKVDISNPGSMQIVMQKIYNVTSYGPTRSSPVIDKNGNIYYTFGTNKIYTLSLLIPST